MLKMSKIALAGAIAAAAMVSTGAHAATVSASAEVDILEAVTVTQTAGLDFGVVAAAAVPGTVTITTGGTRTCTPGLACAGGFQRGAFDVRAADTLAVTITVDPSTTLNFGANSMNLTLTPSTTSVVGAGVATAVPFHVGGTLTVGAAQVAGTYTGNYNVSADYQ